MFSVLLLLLAAGAASANVGWYEAIDVRAGAVLSRTEARGVTITAELLRVARSRDPRRLAWSVTYEFHSDVARTVDAGFPVELTVTDSGQNSGDDSRLLATLLTLMEAQPDGARWAGLAARARAEAENAGKSATKWGHNVDILGGVAAAGPTRLRAAPAQLGELGVLGFKVRHDQKTVAPSSVLLEVQEAPAHLRPEAAAPPDSRALRITYTIPFQLSFPAGASRLEIGWESPVLLDGAFDSATWMAGYLLGPGASWAGSIGRLYVAVERDLLRLDARVGVPFAATPWPGGSSLVWQTSDYEPTPTDRVDLGGSAPFPLGLDTVRYATASESRHLSWGASHVPTLATGSATASSVLAMPNRLPVVEDPPDIPHDVGFGAPNALDGGDHAGWCGTTKDAWIEFDLSRGATGLRVLGGNRNPWFVTDCPDDQEGSLPVRLFEEDTAERCARLRREVVSPSFGRPTAATLRAVDGPLSFPMVFDDAGTAVVTQELPAGRYRLTIDASTPGRGRTTDSVCIAEIVPETLVDPDLLRLLGG